MTSPADPKATLRRQLRASRPDREAQLSQSPAIRAALRDWLVGQPAVVIASFAALHGEPLMLPLLADFPDRRWVFPRINGETMTFHFADAATLAAGAFGISEPLADAPVCAIEDIGLFLCPGMGFTATGQRIGRGMGYYDRALAESSPAAVRVGVCFREQVVAALPTDPHDLPVHFLATPDGVAHCR